MLESFVIVDSEAKKKVFLDFFDQQAEVIVVSSPPFTVSHSELRDEFGQPILAFSLAPIPAQNSIIDKLSEEKNREILLALDNDVPGDYLCWLIGTFLAERSVSAENIKRIYPTGFTKAEIEKSLANAVEVSQKRAHEFYARNLFDLALGRHLQRLIGSNSGPDGRLLNHATLVSLFLLDDRESEIRMFSGKPKWQLIVDFKFGDQTLSACLEHAANITDNGLINDAQEGSEAEAILRVSTFSVEEVERSELIINPPLPYTLLELLNEAHALYKIMPARFAALMRTLLHGVEVNGRHAGLISVFSGEEVDGSEWNNDLRKTATTLFGEDYLGEIEVDWMEGMIRPSMPEIGSEDLATLDDDCRNLYGLIRGRALASQMGQAQGEIIKVKITAGDVLLSCRYKSVDSKGFLNAHEGCYDKELMAVCPVVDIAEGQKLVYQGVRPQQKSKISVERYTFETFFTDLTDFSVTAEPLNLRMVQGLIDGNYMRVIEDGYLLAEPNTHKVVTIINKAFPKMKGVHLSAYIEQTVSEVISGRKGLDFALKQFEQTLMIQGKILVKAKINTKIAFRKRSSSRIIKQEEPRQEEKGVSPQEIEQRSELDEPAGLDDTLVEPTAATGSEFIDAGEEVSEGGAETAGQSAEISFDAEGQDLSLEDDAAADEISDEAEFDQATEDIAAGEEEAESGYQIDAGLLPPGDEEGAIEEPPGIGEHFEADNLAGPGRRDEPGAVPLQGEPASKVEDRKRCQVCGKMMLLKKDQFGKYWSCSGFPSCRHSESFSAKEDLDMACPLCIKGKLVSKRTPTNKTFYVCLDPECEFMAWSRPHYLPCKVCGSPYLIENRKSIGPTVLRCPRAGCNYLEPLPGQSIEGAGKESSVESAAAPRKVRVVRRASGVAGSGKKKVRVVRRKK